MRELTLQELDGQHGEVLPAREELLVGFGLGVVKSTLASTTVVAGTSVLGKVVVVAVV